MVNNWSSSELEEKASSLMENAKKVLIKLGSSHVGKLVCICLMMSKLVGFVPLCEMEDSLLCPLLEVFMENMEEVLSLMKEMEEENNVVFFSMVCILIEETENLRRHSIYYV